MDEPLNNWPDCPHNCQCYKAPKVDLEDTRTTVSLICDGIGQLPTSGNKLIDFDWISGTHLPNLWSLDLRDNHITTIPSGIKQFQFPGIQVLKLERNNLKILMWNTLQPLMNIRELSLQLHDDIEAEHKNVICSSQHVHEVYDNLNNNPDTHYPQFFIDSMNRLLCRDITKQVTVTAACREMHKNSDSYETPQKTCQNWPENSL
ncbi:unnamed protein product [Medioppia subpectinata]|uniref:Uncharacterized protein n=1 Tax=Medioppia subpectinata TaxID=1979941 RepID=A0A7R9KHG2_9ACAR|nr:unnamed protein product [Medioppia subpectinata]CAG2102693.1 unnamed protein product [Medioppia subpectinata]